MEPNIKKIPQIKDTVSEVKQFWKELETRVVIKKEITVNKCFKVHEAYPMDDDKIQSLWEYQRGSKE